MSAVNVILLVQSFIIIGFFYNKCQHSNWYKIIIFTGTLQKCFIFLLIYTIRVTIWYQLLKMEDVPDVSTFWGLGVNMLASTNFFSSFWNFVRTLFFSKQGCYKLGLLKSSCSRTCNLLQFVKSKFMTI